MSIKRKLLGVALALLMTSGAAQAFTQQECEKVWSKENWALSHQKEPPDFTCVSITEQLLMSLHGATKAQVIKAMKANGKPSSNPKYDTLHFLSITNGDVNFQFENDKAVIIFGVVDDAPSGVNFIWNPAQSLACSDLPGSRYARCNKE